MASEETPTPGPKSANGRLIAFALFVGILIGGVAVHFARPAEPEKVVVVQPQPETPKEEVKPSPKPKPLTPVVDMRILSTEDPVFSPLKGPIEELKQGTAEPIEKQAPELPTPAEPIRNAAISTPLPKPRKSPLDPIIAAGLPKPPKPATLDKVVTPPIESRIADLSKFVREELKGEVTEVSEDGKVVGLQVTIASTERAKLLNQATATGARRQSELRVGQAAVDAAQARLASLRQLRQELLQSQSPTSKPVVEAEKDIAAAELAVDEANKALENSKLVFVFDLR